MTGFVTRFAPSPTGRLHLGHVFSAVLVRRAADAAGGVALLRIEDVDQTRCRPEYETGIYQDLKWLGLEWDGDVRRQSDHLGDYADAIETLRARGLLYRCFASRSEIAEATGADDGTAFVSGPLPADQESEKLTQGAPFAWRLSLERAKEALGGARYESLSFDIEPSRGGAPETQKARPDRFGDVALTRKDAPAAYHLAACHDDALQDVTHVIRGEDLIDAPHIQVLLQALMGWPTPIYRHHALLTGPDGKRLSKSDRSKTVEAMRNEGMTAADILWAAGVA